MNRMLVAFATSTMLLVGGISEAQDLFGTVNVFAKVTFYNGDPGSAAFRRLATIGINNSPVAPALPGISNATHVTIPFQDGLYTFALAESGWNKDKIMLIVPENSGGTVQIDHHGQVSLAELFNTLATDHTLLERLSGSTLAEQ